MIDDFDRNPNTIMLTKLYLFKKFNVFVKKLSYANLAGTQTLINHQRLIS